jgi:branched-chain amino acid transport system substrate-binding protein
MGRITRVRVAVLVVAVAAGVFAAAAAARTDRAAAASPIVIGWAFDGKGSMAPFDGPALAAAKIRIGQINAKGGVDGRQLVIKTCDTQNNKPAVAKACADKLLGGGANVIFTTCDVDFAAPVVQEAINRGVLTIAPCIGTDQMGPKRFGPKGKLAFSYGNVAQDEGAADAQIAKKQGWKTAVVVTDKQIVYSQNVCSAFANKFKSLGGKVVGTYSWTQGDHTVANVASKVNSSKADVIQVCTTAAPDISTLLSDVRSAKNTTPILAPWSLDGTYWMPKDPKISTNVWTDSYASIYGDDPDPQVRAMIAQLKAEGHPPTTGGFVTGAAAIDGIVAAVKKANGSLDGPTLAGIMEGFRGLPTLSGTVSFSPALHTVFGREYRVLEVTGGQGHYKYTIKAGGLAPL